MTGSGGGPLTDAPAVNAVLDLLHMADHPDDTIAAFNVANSPLGAVAGEMDSIEWWNDQAARRSIAFSVRRRLLNNGYSCTIADWVRSVAGCCDARELRRLMQLVEMAAGYDLHSTLRANDFIDLVENTPVADVQPAPVQVMTIHQAKGLEFDVVILPELEGQLAGAHTPPVVFEREDETGRISRICRYMEKNTLALAPELQPLFDRHKRRTVRESLSLLYVAMTRAIHGLFMIIDPPSENEKSIPRKASGVLRCALAHDSIEPDSVAHCHGDPKWLKKIAAMKGSQPKDSQTPRDADGLAIPVITLAHGARTNGSAAVKSASKLAERESSHIHVRLAHLPNQDARDRGSAIHALFEQIEWLEEFTADENALLRIAQAKAPRRNEAWARSQVRTFLQLIKGPAVQSALCRGKADLRPLRVQREIPFARLAGTGAANDSTGLQRGYIDRLAIQLDRTCRPIAATVIDFKTDEVDAAQAVGHAQEYRPQMEVYRDAAAEMLGLEPANIAVQVLFVMPGAVVNL